MCFFKNVFSFFFLTWLYSLFLSVYKRLKHLIDKIEWCLNQIKIKSNHFYCHITTAQVPWWVKFLWACSRQCRKTTDNLPMDRQCKKNNKQFTYGQTVQKKKKKNYIWTDSAKKQQTIYIWTDSAKKLHWSIYSAPDSAKKQQQQFTYGQTVQKNNSNLHMDSTYLQTTEENVQNTHTYTQYA